MKNDRTDLSVLGPNNNLPLSCFGCTAILANCYTYERNDCPLKNNREAT